MERFDIDQYYMADKHEALGMGLSYTCHGAFCTENEVYHFHNVFFKIGEDEARLMSPFQRLLLETGTKRCSVLSSSELPSESLSKRSTHQFPRLLLGLFDGVFRRREGSASLPFSKGSPISCSSSLSSVRGFYSSRGLPPADPGGIRPPFVIKYVFIVEFSYTRGGGQPGRPDVFPGRD